MSRVSRTIRIVNFAALAQALASTVRRGRSRRIPTGPAAAAGAALAATAAGAAVARRRRRAKALEPLEDSDLDAPTSQPQNDDEPAAERRPSWVPASKGANGADEDRE
jgi:hypothetical protein